MLQIALLKRSLETSETSWTNYNFDHIPNPVAISLREQIAEKERSLAQEDSHGTPSILFGVK